MAWLRYNCIPATAFASNANLVAAQMVVDQSSAKARNDPLVKYALNQDWSDAYEAVKLPDALSGVRNAIQAAFGRDVRPVAPTAAKFALFDGVHIRSQPNTACDHCAANVDLVR